MRLDLPGWSTKIDEISNGVFRVTLTDIHGRKAEVIDNASNETIEKAIGFAFKIERQVTKNWNKFLYDSCLLLLRNGTIKFHQYNESGFGSWFIELSNDKRLMYNGRDYWLKIQVKRDNDWEDQESIEDFDLTYKRLVKAIHNVEE